MTNDKYIIIKNSSDPEKVGKAYPQTEILSENETDDLDFLETQKGKRIDRKIELNNILLRDKARLTDAIGCSLGPGEDMIINSRFYDILKESVCGPIQFFNVSFQYKKERITGYYWMHFIYELEQFIDFERTSFNYNLFPELKKKPLADYKAFKDFRKEKDKYGFLKSTRTVLKKGFDRTIDIFVLSQVDQNIYVSQNLLKKMESAKITGLDFMKSSIQLL